MAALGKGPVGVAINGESFFFNHYKSGIFDCSTRFCGNSVTDLNHAVLLVGYGVDASTGSTYFILKNQWGTSWGESGYMRIIYDKTGNGCSGINLLPIIPTSNNMASSLIYGLSSFMVATLAMLFTF